MRCLSCGAQMRLQQVAGDESVAVAGFEHHTFTCPACGEVERRRVFTKERTPRILVHAAPAISPAFAMADESTPAPTLAKRMRATLGRAWQAVAPRKPSAASHPVAAAAAATGSAPARHELLANAAAPPIPASIAPIPSMAPARRQLTETLGEPIATSAAIASEPDSGLDECEALLRRAIEIVHGDACSPESGSPDTPSRQPSARPGETESPIKGRDEHAPSQRSAEPQLMPRVPAPAPTPGATTAPSQPAAEPIAPLVPHVIVAAAPKSSSVPPEQKPRPVVVQIHHDHSRGRYVAKDTTSGLGLLRHQDELWLRAMCERMGWKVVEELPNVAARKI
jgi:hypothetical protein